MIKILQDALRNALAASFSNFDRYALGNMEDAVETFENLVEVFHALFPVVFRSLKEQLGLGNQIVQEMDE
jgi:hypothetical protein